MKPQKESAHHPQGERRVGNNTSCTQIYVEEPRLGKIFAVPVEAFLDGEVFRSPSDIVGVRAQEMSAEDATVYRVAAFNAYAWLITRCLRIHPTERHPFIHRTIAYMYERRRRWLAEYLMRHQDVPAKLNIPPVPVIAYALAPELRCVLKDVPCTYEEGVPHIYIPNPVEIAARLLSAEVRPATLRQVMLCETELASLFLACMLKDYRWHPEGEQTLKTQDVYRGRPAWEMLKQALQDTGYPTTKVESLRKHMNAAFEGRKLKPVRRWAEYTKAVVFLHCVLAKLYVDCNRRNLSPYLYVLTTTKVEPPPRTEPKPKPQTKRRRKHRGLNVHATNYSSPRTQQRSQPDDDWQDDGNPFIDSDLYENEIGDD